MNQNNSQQKERVIVLSLRARWCPELFSGTKRIEYRKFFPLDFEGKVFVYECGPNSRHKIIGFFRTRNIARFNPEDLDNEKMVERLVECFETSGAPDSELEDMLSNEETSLACIPVLEPTLFKFPCTLHEFTRHYGAIPRIEHPPMSSMATFIIKDVADFETIAGELKTAQDIKSRSQYTGNTPKTKKNEPELFGGHK